MTLPTRHAGAVDRRASRRPSGQHGGGPELGSGGTTIDGGDGCRELERIVGRRMLGRTEQVDHVDPTDGGDTQVLMGDQPRRVGGEAHLLGAKTVEHDPDPLVALSAGHQFQHDDRDGGAAIPRGRSQTHGVLRRRDHDIGGR